ncbi:MAG: hypothetical protein ACLFR0_03245 [Alphaproteobacteria bacterium]
MGIETCLGYKGALFGPTFGGTEKDIRSQKLKGGYYDLFNSAADLRLAIEETEALQRVELEQLKERQEVFETKLSQATTNLVKISSDHYSGFSSPEL